MNSKLKQDQWMYAGLAGTCATFFFALLSSNVKLSESFFLFLSSLCFGILLPTFTAFLISLSICREKNFSSEAILEALEKKWPNKITAYSGQLLILAFIFLLSHFSLIIGIAMLLLVIIFYSLVYRFLILVRKLDHKHKMLERFLEKAPYQ